MTSTVDAFVGRELGPCRLERLLGKGAMGAVYLAHHTRLDREVAVKIPFKELLDRDPSLADRFQQEARAAAKLHHDRIVTVHDVDTADGQLYLVMEYLPGGSLASFLKERGRLSPPEAARFVKDIAEALEHARRNGIVHRDVKPDNVMIGADGRAKLSDFGLAVATESSHELTMTRDQVGTPAYRSPEQSESPKDADHRSDLYSLGCVFYQLLTGQWPYSADSSYRLMKMHETAPVPDVSVFAPGVPPILSDLIRRLIAKRPEDRPQTAAEVVETLEAYERGQTAPLYAVPPRTATPQQLEQTFYPGTMSAHGQVPEAEKFLGFAPPPPPGTPPPATPPPYASQSGFAAASQAARSKGMWRWVVAAVLVLAAGYGVFAYMDHRTQQANKDYREAMTEGQRGFDGGDYAGAVAAFERALAVSGYSDDPEARKKLVAASTELRRIEDFRTEMEEGQRKFQEKDYKGAVAALTQALSVPGFERDEQARVMLGMAQREEALLENFNNILTEGRRFFGAGNYDAAIQRFERALAVPGYAENEEAVRLRQESADAANNKAFTQTLAEGKKLLDAEKHADAITWFQKAMTIQGYGENAEAKQLLEETQTAVQAEQFDSLLASGRMRFDAKDYAGAAAELRRALTTPGYEENTEAAKLLRSAEEKSRNAATFASAMEEGKRLHTEKNYDAAVAAFQRALAVPEYANDANAARQLQEAEVAGYNVKAFASAFDEGKRLHASGNSAAAAEAIRRALAVPGYAGNGEATLLLREVDFTAAINEGRQQYEAKEYAVAAAAFKRALEVPGYERHEAVLRLSRDADFAATFTEGTRQIEAREHHAAIASFRKALEVPGYEQHEAGWQWLMHAVTNAPPPANMPERISLDCGMGVTLELARIQAGAFMMGAQQGELLNFNVIGGGRRTDAEPQHLAIISKPFYMGIYPITQAQFEAVMGVNPSHFKGRPDSLNRPVENVNWNDAMEFCRRFSQISGMDVRLPTEAEWEYTARAGITLPFHFGATINGTQANYMWGNQFSEDGGRHETTTVDTFQPNAWGLYDMYGNVWEWCADWYGRYSESSVIDPQGPENGQERVGRGGAWDSRLHDCRSASRNHGNPGNRNSITGFRIVITFSATALDQAQFTASSATSTQSPLASAQFEAPPSTSQSSPSAPQSAQPQFVQAPAPQQAAPAQTQSAAQYQQAFTAAMTEGQRKHSAGDYAGAAASFQQAMQIPGFRESPDARRWLNETQTAAQQVSQRQSQYFTAMETGRGLFNAGEHEQATEAFKRVLLIPGYSSDQEAMQWLARAQGTVDNRRQYAEAMQEGERLYERSRDYDGARAAFSRALGVPGYANDREARQWLGRIQQDLNTAAQYESQYASLIREGQSSLQEAKSQFLGINSRRYFDEAAASFQRAMEIPGYERDETARRLLNEVQGEIRRIESNRSNNTEINPLQLLFGRQ